MLNITSDMFKMLEKILIGLVYEGKEPIIIGGVKILPNVESHVLVDEQTYKFLLSCDKVKIIYDEYSKFAYSRNRKECIVEPEPPIDPEPPVEPEIPTDPETGEGE